MSLSTLEACFVIGKARGEAIVVSTMSAMFSFAAVSPSPLNLSSVPLMGGASGLGLGLAIAQPKKRVLVLDGDASLLMELGTMAQISEQAPSNFIHFVFNNNAQFAGLANLNRPGGAGFDFCAVALGAGYTTAKTLSSIDDMIAHTPIIMGSPGPHFVELCIDDQQTRFVKEMPQPEIPNLQFERMGGEAKSMMEALGVNHE